MKKHRKIETIIALVFAFIVVSSTSYLVYINYFSSNETVASNGEASFYLLNEKDKVKLDGAWEFYPNKFIDPTEDFEKYENIKELKNVPRNKKQYTQETHEGVDAPFGTYRLKINVKTGLYGIKFKTVRSAYNVYAGEEMIVSLGEISEYQHLSVKDSQYRFALLSSVDDEIVLTIHVSKHGFEDAFISSVEFGPAEIMLREQFLLQFAEGSFGVMMITLAIYYIVLYFRRKDITFLRSFSLMSLSGGMMLLLLQEQVLRTLFNFNITVRYLLMNIFFVILNWSILLFLSEIYKEYTNRNILKFLNFGFIFLAMYSPVQATSLQSSGRKSPERFLILVLVLNALYVFYLLWKVYKDQAKGYLYTCIISITILTYASILITKSYLDIDIGLTQQVLFTVVLWASIFLISSIYYYDYEFALGLSEIIEKNGERSQIFFQNLSNSFLKPLRETAEDINALVVEKFGNISIDKITKMSGIRNKILEMIYKAENVGHVFSQTESKLKELRVKTNLKDFIKEILDSIQLTIDKNSVYIYNGVQEDAWAYLNRFDFNTAFSEIIKNAIDNFKSIGIIEVTLETINQNIFIRISDNGPGIPKDKLPYIFDIFYKVDDTSSEKFGLGLTIAKKIMENNDGSISIQSSVDEGTQVTLQLNAIPEEGYDDTVVVVDKAHDILQNEEINVLFVSDDQGLFENLSLYFKNIYVSQQHESNHDSLTKEIIDKRIDVVVLDYNYDKNVGDNLVEHIREIGGMYVTPILIMAKPEVISNIWALKQDTVNDYITTPTPTNNIAQKIIGLYNSKLAIKRGIEKEFRYLYSQISPHFLYNTLNTIIGLSYVDPGKTRDALYNLSVYLRAKLDVYDTSAFVSIEKEMETIQAYLEIEKMRYSENIEITIDVEKDLDLLVPPLMIQNIVENIFKHAFDFNKTDNKINIKIYEAENTYHIIVSDNGKGMGEVELEKIRIKHSKGIGYRNTYERLELIEDSKMMISSKPGYGTEIAILIKRRAL